MNLAIEEALLRCRLEHSSPDTLRLWQNPPAIVIGCFQNPASEAKAAACKKLGVTVLRRVSGGGAVHHDLGNLNYSIIIKKSSLNFQVEDVEMSYGFLCGGVVNRLKTIGVKAHRQKRTIMVGKKKISGSAQYRLYDAVLHHGTLMINVNLAALGYTLGISKPRKLLLNLSDVLREITLSKVKEAVTKGFERTLHVKFKKGTLTPMEKQVAKTLYEMKYSKRDWNIGKNPSD